MTAVFDSCNFVVLGCFQC